MANIVVVAEQLIERPIDVVRAQFFDMRHHIETGVHPDLGLFETRLDGQIWHLRSRRKMLGRMQENETQLERLADGNLRLRGVGGAIKGLLVDQRFDAVGPERTRVNVRLELPARGLLALLAPLLRKKLSQDTQRSLDEDRRDLEEGGYSLAAQS